MTSLDPEDVIDEAVHGREPSAILKRQRQPRRIRLEPRSPLAALVSEIGHQTIEFDGNTHCPIPSLTDSIRTGARFSARMPASMVLRSPTTTTAKRPGWMWVAAAFCTAAL